MAKVEVTYKGGKWAWTLSEEEARIVVSMVGQYLAEQDKGIWPEDYEQFHEKVS